MAVQQRKRVGSPSKGTRDTLGSPGEFGVQREDDRLSSWSPTNDLFLAIKIALALVILSAIFFIVSESFLGSIISPTSTLKYFRVNSGNSNAIEIQKDVAPDVILILSLTTAAEMTGKPQPTASLGTHSVSVTIAQRCPQPRFWIRVAGDALVGVLMVENEAGNWDGVFDLPMSGSYHLDVRWYGCSDSSDFEHIEIPFQAVDEGKHTATVAPESINEGMFEPTSVWLKTELMNKRLGGIENLPNYLWMKPGADPTAGNLLRTQDSIVLTEGTLRHPDNYYDFQVLSNYELVW